MAEFIGQDLLYLIQALLPGFISAWVFYGLTAYNRPSTFERTVQALIYTMFIQVILLGIRRASLFLGYVWSWGVWTTNVQLVWSVIVALLMGAVFAGLANNNTIHEWFIFRSWWRIDAYC